MAGRCMCCRCISIYDPHYVWGISDYCGCPACIHHQGMFPVALQCSHRALLTMIKNRVVH